MPLYTQSPGRLDPTGITGFRQGMFRAAPVASTEQEIQSSHAPNHHVRQNSGIDRYVL